MAHILMKRTTVTRLLAKRLCPAFVCRSFMSNSSGGSDGDDPQRDNKMLLKQLLESQRRELENEKKLRKQEVEAKQKELEALRREVESEKKMRKLVEGQRIEQVIEPRKVPGHPVWGQFDFRTHNLPDLKSAGRIATQMLVADNGTSILIQNSRWQLRQDGNEVVEKMVAANTKSEEALRKYEAETGNDDLVIVQEGIPPIDQLGEEKGDDFVVLRKGVWRAVKKVFELINDGKDALVIGHPGIGKTRAGAMLTLQMLLKEGAPVTYISYKTGVATLFLPFEDGSYKIWECSLTNPAMLEIIQDLRMITIIDPLEEGSYLWQLRSRVIKYCSNDHRKHYYNADKNERVGFVIMGSPSLAEMKAMAPIFMKKSELTEAEIEKRCWEVGRAMRYVFNDVQYKRRVASMELAAKKMVQNISKEYVPFAYKNPQDFLGGIDTYPLTASSKLFLLEEDGTLTMLGIPWIKLYEESCALEADPRQFEQIATDHLNKGSELLVQELGPNGDMLPVKKMSFGPFQLRKAVMKGEGVKERIRQDVCAIEEGEMVATRASPTFPVYDIATSKKTWWNAKSGKSGYAGLFKPKTLNKEWERSAYDFKETDKVELNIFLPSPLEKWQDPLKMDTARKIDVEKARNRLHFRFVSWEKEEPRVPRGNEVADVVYI